jgi:hypothetical protein
MGWMIAALVISAAILGGTWYYTQQDDRSRKIKPAQDGLPGDEAANAKNVSLKSIWDIEDIRDSVVFLRNNRYSAVMSVGAIDFRMMSDQEQASTENALVQAALSLPFDMQLYASSEYVDTEACIQSIAAGSAGQSPKLTTYADQAINYLTNLMKSRNVYVRRNYIIVSYDGAVDKAYEELNRYCNTAIAALQRARVPARRLTSSEILNLIHSKLNRGSSVKPADIADSGGFDLYVSGAQERE